jgi:methylated-DNA-[protein]-cysteine S-methyltransferase
MIYAAILNAPFAHLGVQFDAVGIQRIDFLPTSATLITHEHPHIQQLARALNAYWQDAHYQPFNDVPVSYLGTPHQTLVWQKMRDIPVGQTRYYGEVAQQIGSSPRAVGQACGVNPLPILIPCHRIIGKSNMGGFMHSTGDAALGYKQWLLAHERVIEV